MSKVCQTFKVILQWRLIPSVTVWCRVSPDLLSQQCFPAPDPEDSRPRSGLISLRNVPLLSHRFFDNFDGPGKTSDWYHRTKATLVPWRTYMAAQRFFFLVFFFEYLPIFGDPGICGKTAVLSYFGFRYNTRCELEPDPYSYWSCGSSQARLVVLDADTPAKQCSISATAPLEK